LSEVRALALSRGLELLEAQSAVDIAEAQRIVARALPNPQLVSTIAKLNTTDLPPGTTPTGSARDTVIAVGQLVEIGKRGPRGRAADAGTEAARARLDFVRSQVDTSVVKAYVAALAADEGARIARASAGSLRRSAEIAEARLGAGEISEAERDQVRIAAGRFEADTRGAEAAAVEARIVLERLVGYPHPDGSVGLADDLRGLASLGASLAARAGGEEAAPSGERGDVRAAAATLDQASAELQLQRALRTPDPTLLVQYERDLSLPAPDSIGVGLSFSLPLFSRNQGGIRAAEAGQRAASRDLERTRARVEADVAAARAAYRAARERQALFDQDLLPRAERVQQTVAFAYEKGAASLLELLEAERNLNDLRTTALSAQAEALASAADLAAALGGRLE
jgi:cobalt-zinc-cadmium efflux system outer membrane protein